jgi:inhibitor of cysteine peptidase
LDDADFTRRLSGTCEDVAEYVFDEKDNGAQIQVERGAKITIELKENPTTGYRWTIGSIDQAMLAAEGDEFLPPGQKSPGAGGLRRFFFRAKAEGSTALTLVNKRAWERDDKAVSTFNLTIHIAS